MRKSGYYWRCPCGHETHSYSKTDLDKTISTHKLFHDKQIERIREAKNGLVSK